MNPIQTKQYDSFDLLKAIAIFLVVFYHFHHLETSFLSHTDRVFIWNYFLHSLFSICVPIFFFVHGALLFHKPHFSLIEHIVKILRLVFLTLFWGTITLFLLSLIRHEPLSLFQFLQALYQLKEGWINHLWFLEALVVLYFFFPLLHLAFHHERKYFFFFFLVIFFATFGNTFLGYIMTMFSFFTGICSECNLHLNYWSYFHPVRGIFGYSIGYFMIGGILFAYRDVLLQYTKKRVLLLLFIFSMACLTFFGMIFSKRQGEIWDIGWNGYDSIFALGMVICLFFLTLSYRHSGFFGKIVGAVGKNSLGIYFTHILIGGYISSLHWNMVIKNNTIFNILFILVLLFASLGMTLILKKIPFLSFLVSGRETISSSFFLPFFSKKNAKL